MMARDRVGYQGRKLRTQNCSFWGKIHPCPNKLMDNRTTRTSFNEGCSGPVFPCLCTSSHMPLTDGPTWPPGTTRGHHCEEMAPQSAGAHSSSVFLFFFLLLPVASLSLFSFAFHTQAIKSVSQHCDPLQHSLFLFFVIFLFLSFSPSLPPSCRFLPRVRRSRLGVEQREEENPGGGVGVTFAALWLTTCVSEFCIYMFLMEKSVVEGDDGRGKTSIWFLFVELSSESNCLFPAMSRGKYKCGSSPGSG